MPPNYQCPKTKTHTHTQCENIFCYFVENVAQLITNFGDQFLREIKLLDRFFFVAIHSFFLSLSTNHKSFSRIKFPFFKYRHMQASGRVRDGIAHERYCRLYGKWVKVPVNQISIIYLFVHYSNTEHNEINALLTLLFLRNIFHPHQTSYRQLHRILSIFDDCIYK